MFRFTIGPLAIPELFDVLLCGGKARLLLAVALLLHVSVHLLHLLGDRPNSSLNLLLDLERVFLRARRLAVSVLSHVNAVVPRQAQQNVDLLLVRAGSQAVFVLHQSLSNT